MSFNGSGTFNINTSGQPVASGQTISDTVFNALTADLASGLSTAICKDGQTTPTANIPLGGYKLTGVGIGTATTDAAVVQNVNARNMCEGRLTLTTGVPVTTSDVTAAETLYFTAFRGNCIALYDGTNWYRRTFTEASIDVPDATNCYDVFAYDNGGTVTLELTAWTNTTTRATALTTHDGVLVKTGATTRRYLGTFYSTTAGNGQIEDSVANRYLWNYYNRVARPMRAVEATATWNYTTPTWRQANNAAANQLNFVVGVVEDAVDSRVVSMASNGTANISITSAAIRYDDTPAPDAGCLFNSAMPAAAGSLVGLSAQLLKYPAVGKHYLAWLEYSTFAGTTTWYGTNTNWPNPGIHGVLMG